MSGGDLDEYVGLAIKLRNIGRRVVGIDVCGGDMRIFMKHVLRALGLSVHIAEVRNLYKV
jgi:hypothetical protein